MINFLQLAFGLTALWVSQSSIQEIPGGGYAVIPIKPIWFSGVDIDEPTVTEDYPEKQKTEHLAIVNAGIWLANSDSDVAVLVYSFEIDIEKSFQSLVYTRSTIPNPANPESPVIYEGVIEPEARSINVNHHPIKAIEMMKKYTFQFEVFEDEGRTNRIELLIQEIKSPVENISGCVEIEDRYKRKMFGGMVRPDGEAIPVKRIQVVCKKGQ